MTKTTFATHEDHAKAMQTWHVVDASEHVLGRMATRIAEVLMGKHTPIYTPHVNVGDGVVVINAAQLKVTGTKRETKVYRHYSGYPGGLKYRSLEERVARNPEALIKDAVRRMLPKSRMGRAMLSRLKVYAGTAHPHSAQRPLKLVVPHAPVGNG